MDKTVPRENLEQALAQLTERTLSRNERYGHLVLVLFGGGMAVAVGTLLLTEPNLPPRTSLAFAVVMAIGIAWTAFGVRVLWRRLPVLANREIVAGRMSVFFSSLFTLGAILAGGMTSGKLVTGATVDGLTMTAIALALLVRAHLRRSSLQALRARLEQELAASK